MKQLSIISRTESRQIDNEVFVGTLTSLLRIQEINATPNIFLIQNKGKGPPGMARGPDT